MNRTHYITDKIIKVRSEIKPSQLIAVTKYASLEDTQIVYESGQKDLGEARVTQLQERAQYFVENSLNKVRWHFIGNIQTNKINRLLKVPNLYAIHSVSSQKILEGLYERIDLYQGEKLRFFIQIKTSNETEKNGVENYDELSQMVNYILGNQHAKLCFCGFMTMGSIRTESFQDDAVKSFSKLNKIKNRIHREYLFKDKLLLSMGMSQDYKLAIENGSDYVRIGSALFPPEEL